MFIEVLNASIRNFSGSLLSSGRACIIQSKVESFIHFLINVIGTFPPSVTPQYETKLPQSCQVTEPFRIILLTQKESSLPGVSANIQYFK